MAKKDSQEFNEFGFEKNLTCENKMSFLRNEIKLNSIKPTNSNQYKKDNLSNAKIKRIQKNASLASKTASVLIATLTATSVGVAKVVEFLPTKENTHIEIYAEENYVSYFVELEGYKEGDVYSVKIYNDFTNREQVFEDGEVQGFEENLKPHLKYTLAVKKGSKIIAKKDFVTESRRDKYQDEYYQDDEYYNDDPYLSDENIDPTGRPTTRE